MGSLWFVITPALAVSKCPGRCQARGPDICECDGSEAVCRLEFFCDNDTESRCGVEESRLYDPEFCPTSYTPGMQGNAMAKH